jgi:hypothetical protein
MAFEHLTDAELVQFIGPHFPEHEGVSPDPSRRAKYLRSRLAGHSHGFASVVATKRFPGTMGTDRTLFEGRKLDGAQFEGSAAERWVGETYRKRAEAAGVSTTGKYYLGQLAASPGDPEAWVSGVGDVKRVCEQRGWSCDGSVKVGAPVYQEPPEHLRPDAPYRVAPDIVARHVADRLAEDPGARVEEVRESVATQLAGDFGKAG